MNQRHLIRTDVQNPDFRMLVKHLDQELALIDGEEHAFYATFFHTDIIRYVLIAYDGGQPIACGGLKDFDPNSLEIKRMYTLPDYRSQGIGSLLLAGLEAWAGELGFSRCLLETGTRQPDAIRLYEKNGYTRIPNFAPYDQAPLSVCFQKLLIL
ncbi:MAG: GNAT family N-acetyltransferase [Saprospiraceae bacterium]|nr:GNAT family N-acetyltransferase [Saprospiraceae bacterium]